MKFLILTYYNKAVDLIPGAGLNNMELASLLNRGNALKHPIDM
jgi:hypothetical protein